MAPPTRPVLRYHGGKWLLAPWIIGFFPPHRVYVEPYGGGASVLLRKERSYAEVYNDLATDVVNLFRVLQNQSHAARLVEVLKLTPFARDEFVLAYEHTGDPIEAARRLIIRAFMGHGSDSMAGIVSGFRANSNKSGTTPAHDWVNYAPALALAIARLRGVIIENRDALEVIARHDSQQTLHYVDPPYVHATRAWMRSGKGKGNYRYEMTDDDHRVLARILRGVQGMVVLSGYPCDLYDRELYPDWTRFERPHRADGARPRTEVVWLNPACAAALALSQAQGHLLGAAQ